MDVRGHILGVLWLMLIGYHIDEKVYEHSYGNRIRKKLYNELSEQPTYSPYLFEPYFEQYESWRDTAMDYACDNLKNNQDVVIITMDFKRFYYSVDINKDAFEQIFQDAFEDIDDNIEDKEFLVRLNDFLSALVEKYSSLFDVDEFNGRRILPIGFCHQMLLLTGA